jgi:hypothetical protein
LSVTVAIGLHGERLEALSADLLIAAFFEDDRPLRGPAARLDWRTCGLLTQQLHEGRLRGARGEAALFPSAGTLKAPRLLLVGLGARPGFGESELRHAALDAARKALALRAGTVGFALLPERSAGLAAEREALQVLTGFCQALRERPAPLRLVLAASASDIPRVGARLAAAFPTLAEGGLALRLEGASDLPRGLAAPRTRRPHVQVPVPGADWELEPPHRGGRFLPQSRSGSRNEPGR